jgi:voltage-gated potassium channel Kch
MTGAPIPGEADAVVEHAPVLVAGFGAFGSTTGRLLKANGVETTVLDFDSDRVDLLLDVHPAGETSVVVVRYG